MRVKTSIVAVVVLCGAVASQGKTCKYWCKSDHDDAYYCCQSGKPDTGLAQLMWPLMSSPIFWMGLIGTSLGIHAHTRPPHHEEMPPPPMKKKTCPPLRMICPRGFDYYDPPNHCDKDDECSPTEKCCYDVCLEHKTCKPAM